MCVSVCYDNSDNNYYAVLKIITRVTIIITVRRFGFKTPTISQLLVTFLYHYHSSTVLSFGVVWLSPSHLCQQDNRVSETWTIHNRIRSQS